MNSMSGQVLFCEAFLIAFITAPLFEPSTRYEFGILVYHPSRSKDSIRKTTVSPSPVRNNPLKKIFAIIERLLASCESSVTISIGSGGANFFWFDLKLLR